jgi:glycogen(starch) synthase
MRWEVSKLFDIPADDIAVIPNGIDANAWTVTDDAKAAMRARHPSPVVLFTGRLEWEKGVQTLIEAIPAIRKRVPGAHFVIAGRGSQAEVLQEQVKKLKVGREVTFYGWLPEDELHALVASADVAVVPSLYEPFGIVALEAAAVGTPLVVARTGGLAEIVIDGTTGWTFEPGSAEGLAAAVSDALSAPSEARARAEASVERVLRDFNWTVIAEQTRGVYVEAVQHPRSGIARTAAQFDPPPGNLLTGALS